MSINYFFSAVNIVIFVVLIATLRCQWPSANAGNIRCLIFQRAFIDCRHWYTWNRIQSQTARHQLLRHNIYTPVCPGTDGQSYNSEEMIAILNFAAPVSTDTSSRILLSRSRQWTDFPQWTNKKDEIKNFINLYCDYYWSVHFIRELVVVTHDNEFVDFYRSQLPIVRLLFLMNIQSSLLLGYRNGQLGSIDFCKPKFKRWAMNALG